MERPVVALAVNQYRCIDCGSALPRGARGLRVPAPIDSSATDRAFPPFELLLFQVEKDQSQPHTGQLSSILSLPFCCCSCCWHYWLLALKLSHHGGDRPKLPIHKSTVVVPPPRQHPRRRRRRRL